MFQKINDTAQVTDALIREGKVTSLNSAEHVRAISDLNKELEQVRRDYKIKNQDSQKSAAFTILTS